MTNPKQNAAKSPGILAEECGFQDDMPHENLCDCGEGGWREVRLPNGSRVCRTCAYDYADMKHDERKEEGW